MLKKQTYLAVCEVNEMNKKSVLWVLLDLVFLIVFNTVFFVAGGTEHPASVWLSYGFIHFSYIMVLVTPFLIRKSSSSAVFGFSIYSISATYFFVEFITGLVFIFLKQESVKPALIVQIIIAGIYAIILISHLIANESTADSVERHEDEVAFIKQSSARIKPLIGKLSSKKANKEIEKAYDLLHSSPSMSISTVKLLEASILEKIAELESAISSGDENAAITKAGEVIALTEDRNRKIRTVE